MSEQYGSPAQLGADSGKLHDNFIPTSVSDGLNSLQTQVNLKAINSETPHLIAFKNAINLKANDRPTLYTVPADTKIRFTDIHIRPTGVDTITVAPSVRIGLASSYNELLDTTALTGLDSYSEFWKALPLGGAGLNRVFVAGDVIKFDVPSLATATNFYCECFLYGILETV